MKSSILALLALSIFVSAAAEAGNDCHSCHGQKGMQGYIDMKSFQQSVHGAMDCTKCHMTSSSYPHKNKAAGVNCGGCHLLGRDGAPSKNAHQYKQSVHGRAVASGNAAAPKCQTCHGSHYIYKGGDERSGTNRAKIPSLCSQCHPGPAEAYAKSIHGREFLENNNPGVPTCFDCHMEHLAPGTTEEQWKLWLIKQCGDCHPGEMNTYHKTYHGKVARLGYDNIAKCSDCHGSHDILPPSDPGSKLSEKNIVATCDTCHKGSTLSFTKFYAHAEEGNREKYPVLYYTYMFMTTLLISVFAFFLTHTLLWAFRALKERSKKKGGE